MSDCGEGVCDNKVTSVTVGDCVWGLTVTEVKGVTVG